MTNTLWNQRRLCYVWIAANVIAWAWVGWSWANCLAGNL